MVDVAALRPEEQASSTLPVCLFEIIRAAPATPAASVGALSASGHASREAAASWNAEKRADIANRTLMTRPEEVSEPGNAFADALTIAGLDWQKTVLTSRRNPRRSLDIRQGDGTGRRRRSTSLFAAPVSADPRLTPWDRVMLITICRLYDSYADANRVVIGLEVAGIAPPETSLISNNSDTWYRTGNASNVVPLRKQGASRDTATSGKFESAAVGGAIGATAATAASLVTMLALPGVGAVVGAGWLAALLGSMAIGGATGGLLGALTNAGISEEDAHVFVEGVRRGGTLVAARVLPTDVPRVEAMMNHSAVKLGERCDLYRKSGWQAFDPSAVPYTADQVRSERALHAH